MTYQLKTTGIATKLLMCIAVDPDTGTIKDFASPAVTADMTVDAGITIGTQAWDGITRSYFKLAASSYVRFGTNKPGMGTVLTGDQRTVAWIGETGTASPGNTMVFGTDSSNYFGIQNFAGGGSTFPTIRATGYSSGAQAVPASGTKKIFGFSFERGGSGFFTAYSATDTDSAMTVYSAATNSGSISWTLSYVGRRNDSAGISNDDKIHAILIFNDDLIEAEWDTLRDDWFGTLLESAGGGDTTPPTLTSPTGTQTGSTTATVGATTNEANGTLYSVVTLSATPPSVAQIQAGQNSSGTAAAYASSQSISSTGAKTFSATGLSASTAYYAHIQHKDAAGNDSTVVTSASFTTTAGGGTVYGFDFDTAAGMVFGDLAGALTSLTRQVSVNVVARAYSTSTGALVATSGTLTTDSAGRLARWEDAAISNATAYVITFTRASDGEVCAALVTAT